MGPFKALEMVPPFKSNVVPNLSIKKEYFGNVIHGVVIKQVNHVKK